MKLKQLTSGSMTVLLVTVFNRGTGYLRDILMTAALGASRASQIFVLAFRVFGVVRALTSESAIPTIVVDRYVNKYSRPRSIKDRSYVTKCMDMEWGIVSQKVV